MKNFKKNYKKTAKKLTVELTRLWDFVSTIALGVGVYVLILEALKQGDFQLVFAVSASILAVNVVSKLYKLHK